MIAKALGAAAGAFVGGMARYGLSRAVPNHWGTFTANMVAAFAFGLAAQLLLLTDPTQHEFVYALACTGFAGGLSTWSTLAEELGEMNRAHQWRDLIGYASATVGIGVILAWRGAVWAARIYHGS